MKRTDRGAISYFARTNFHQKHKLFGIKQADRLSHVYVVGKTGVGKSTLIETLARQDLEAGRGFALVDPHGEQTKGVSSKLLKPPASPTRPIRSLIRGSLAHLPILFEAID